MDGSDSEDERQNRAQIQAQAAEISQLRQYERGQALVVDELRARDTTKEARIRALESQLRQVIDVVEANQNQPRH